ncbi:hypothetical protein [Georgenia sp. SUBG003]|uniref:hypothetical protein n=1 Tax=Georgenia sp. SUBG003 TaxID=1497974 RepID=UPI003AB4E391
MSAPSASSARPWAAAAAGHACAVAVANSSRSRTHAAARPGRPARTAVSIRSSAAIRRMPPSSICSRWCSATSGRAAVSTPRHQRSRSATVLAVIPVGCLAAVSSARVSSSERDGSPRRVASRASQASGIAASPACPRVSASCTASEEPASASRHRPMVTSADVRRVSEYSTMSSAPVLRARASRSSWCRRTPASSPRWTAAIPRFGSRSWFSSSRSSVMAKAARSGGAAAAQSPSLTCVRPSSRSAKARVRVVVAASANAREAGSMPTPESPPKDATAAPNMAISRARSTSCGATCAAPSMIIRWASGREPVFHSIRARRRTMSAREPGSPAPGIAMSTNRRARCPCPASQAARAAA